eukprot:1052513_1
MSTPSKHITFERIGENIFNFFNPLRNVISVQTNKRSLSINGKTWIEKKALAGLALSIKVKVNDFETISIGFFGRKIKGSNVNSVLPSLEIESNRFGTSKYTDLTVALATTPTMRILRFNAHYYRYLLDFKISEWRVGNLSAIYDAYDDKTLLIGTTIQHNESLNRTKSIGFGVEYTRDTMNMLSIKMIHNMQQNILCKVGFKRSKLLNEDKNTLYGQIEYDYSTAKNKIQSVQSALGINRKVNDGLSVDAFISTNKYAFIGLNHTFFFDEYSTSKIDTKIGTTIDFQQKQLQPKLQYQCSLDWML